MSIERGVGSCCTLLGELLKEWRPSQSFQECALLLEGVILLDTMNLSPLINKTTNQDREIVEFLDTNHPSIPLLQNELFDRLSNAKYDPVFWSSISLKDALEYDYKVFKLGSYQFGWSVVLTTLSSFLSSDQALHLIRSFCNERKLDGLVFSSVVSGDILRREFYIYQMNTNDLELKKRIQRVEKALECDYHCERESNSVFVTSTPVSRKGLAPVLMKLFE